MNPELLFILPTYGQFEYAADAARTFVEHSPENSVCALVDDASPGFNAVAWDRWREGIPLTKLHTMQFLTNGGLTRSWNEGLCYAQHIKAKYAICGNSDILFTPGWWEPIKRCIDEGAALVGPVTNAPGRTASAKQHIKHYLKDYRVSDDPAELRKAAEALAQRNRGRALEPCEVNGFFMVASTEQWWRGAFQADKYVFDPGRRMEYNEVELQKRWRREGWPMGCATESFVFHYRSVTRGDKYKSPGWYRKQPTQVAP